MSAPAILRNNYSDLFSEEALPALEEVFRWNLAQHPSRREVLFNMKSTDRDIYQTSELADLPLHNEVAEGQDYSFYAPKQGANKTIKPVKWGMGFSISEEVVDDGKIDMVADALEKLAKSAKESQEISAMNILNLGFSSAVQTADGVNLFSTAHTLPSGGTFRNKLSSDADLSVSSLETMLQDFETQFIGDTGIIYDIKPKYLVVHPSFKRLAKELIGSDLKPEVAQFGTDGITNVNNMNSYKEEGLSVISSPHLTDTDAWFMVAEKKDTGLVIVNRRGIVSKSEMVFKNDSIMFKSSYREKVDVVHPYGIFGSQGA